MRRRVVCECLKRVHVTDYNMRTLTVNEAVKHDSVHYNPSESGSTCSVDLATQPNKHRERQLDSHEKSDSFKCIVTSTTR